MLLDEGLEEGDDLLLLVAREVGGGREKLAHLAGGALAALGAGLVDEILDADAAELGDGLELVGAEGDGVAFPVGVGGLRNAELLGGLGLGKAGGEARGVKALPEGGARLFGWAAAWHARIIRGEVGFYGPRLHKYGHNP